MQWECEEEWERRGSGGVVTHSPRTPVALCNMTHRTLRTALRQYIVRTLLRRVVRSLL